MVSLNIKSISPVNWRLNGLLMGLGIEKTAMQLFVRLELGLSKIFFISQATPIDRFYQDISNFIL